MWHRRLTKPEHRQYVRAEDAHDFLRRNLGDALMRLLVGRVVHKYVEVTKLLARAFDKLLAESFLAYIALNSYSFASSALHDHHGLLRIAIRLQVSDQAVCALPRKGQRHCSANAAIASGNNRGLALQLPTSFV